MAAAAKRPAAGFRGVCTSIAPAAGRVKFVGQNGGMGNTVVIDHGYGFETRYAHLSDFRVKRGQRVERGDVVGLMGSTGYSTGPHLHFELHPTGPAAAAINPYPRLRNAEGRTGVVVSPPKGWR